MNPVQKITVERIYDNRNDAKSPNKTLQLRVERDKEGTSNILNQFLKGGFTNVEKLIKFQPMHEDHIKELGLKEGDNLNDKLSQPVKLVVSELTESEYSVLSNKEQIPYSNTPKINPTTNQALVTEDGELIHRGILMVANSDTLSDVYVKHTGSVDYEPKESTIDDVANELAS